jgi:hypothetical protein
VALPEIPALPTHTLPLWVLSLRVAWSKWGQVSSWSKYKHSVVLPPMAKILYVCEGVSSSPRKPSELISNLDSPDIPGTAFESGLKTCLRLGGQM